MNTPNPLIPQGSIPRTKSTVRIAFFTIAALHVLFIGGLLMQGCKKSDNKPIATEMTNEPPQLPPIVDVPPTNSSVNNVQPPVEPPPTVPPTVDVSVAGTAKEYVVMKNDSFSTISKKTGVSIKAIEAANPGVSSTKLKVGQKLQIPAGGAVASEGTTGAPLSASPNDGTIYTVKANDMLEKIARAHGTTAKAIMSLNNLKTTTIKVGQKLKLPAGHTPTTDAPATDGVKLP
ncbi:MAG: LysM peptidoglycan-binding domain-containing protein [Verrucomicrobiota bacterium]